MLRHRGLKVSLKKVLDCFFVLTTVQRGQPSLKTLWLVISSSSQSLTPRFLPLQILDPQDFEEFPAKPLDSLQPQDSTLTNSSPGQLAPSGLDSLGQHLELELGLGTGAAVGSGVGIDIESGAAAAGSSLGAGLDFGSGVCMGAGAGAGPAAGTEVSSLDPETQRRRSLQEPQTPLDSRTPQRHSSDPGGS